MTDRNIFVYVRNRRMVKVTDGRFATEEEQLRAIRVKPNGEVYLNDRRYLTPETIELLRNELEARENNVRAGLDPRQQDPRRNVFVYVRNRRMVKVTDGRFATGEEQLRAIRVKVDGQVYSSDRKYLTPDNEALLRNIIDVRRNNSRISKDEFLVELEEIMAATTYRVGNHNYRFPFYTLDEATRNTFYNIYHLTGNNIDIIRRIIQDAANKGARYIKYSSVDNSLRFYDTKITYLGSYLIDHGGFKLGRPPVTKGGLFQLGSIHLDRDHEGDRLRMINHAVPVRTIVTAV